MRPQHSELLGLNAIGRSTGPDEFELISKAGDHIWVEITTTPIKEQGKVIVLGFVRDISNRKKDADNLRIKDKAIASSINAIAMTDMNGVITYVNESFLKLWGYHKEKEVLKKPIVQFYGDKTQISEMFNTIYNRGNWIGELTAEKRNGSVFHVQLSASIVTDESDIPIQIMTACVDITDRKQIEDSLRQSEERYRSLYELSPLGISILDMKGIIKYCNPAIFKNGGYSEVELIGKHFSKVAPLKFHNVPRLLGIFKSVVMGEVAGPLEISYTHKDGSTCWTEIYAGLLKANGKNIGIQVVQKDITETKQAEQALIQSEGRFKTLAEQSPNMIFIFQDNQIVYANFRCEEITGYNREEFYDPNFSFFTLITPESVEIVRLNLEKCKKGKDVPPYEYRILTKDGKKLEALINTRLFTYNGKPAILGTISDVTEYKNALERLRDSENKLNLVFDSVDDGIIVTDIMGKITQVNESAVKMHGYARKDELLGQQLNSLIESKTQDIFMDNLNKIKHLHLPQALELCLVKSNGDTYPAQANVAIMSDERCNPVGFVTVIEDITERRKMEKTIEKRLKRYSVL